MWDAETRKNPDDGIAWSERGRALRCLGRLDESLQSFVQANEKYRNDAIGLIPYLNEIGTTQWMLGRRREAIHTLKLAVDGVLDRSIQYTDNAGGVSHGVLLWYAAVSVNDAITQEHARTSLQLLSRKGNDMRYWPGPLALFVLNQMTFQEMLERATGSKDLKRCVASASTDLLKRRQLCRALFYAAVELRAAGDERACLRGMRQCADLENPILENEWYLARNELEMADQSE